jgi:hypothetical protein
MNASGVAISLPTRHMVAILARAPMFDGNGRSDGNATVTWTYSGEGSLTQWAAYYRGCGRVVHYSRGCAS